MSSLLKRPPSQVRAKAYGVGITPGRLRGLKTPGHSPGHILFLGIISLAGWEDSLDHLPIMGQDITALHSAHSTVTSPRRTPELGWAP